MTRTSATPAPGAGHLPSPETDSLLVLDAMTGSRSGTMRLLRSDPSIGAPLLGRVQLAQAGAGAMSDTIPLPPGPGSSEAARRIARGGVIGLGVGGAAISGAEALREVRDHEAPGYVEDALQRFNLNRNSVADVFATRAYAWAVTQAPWHYFWHFEYDLNFSGAVNEAFAQSLMRYEREYPGTLGAAVTRNDPAAWMVIDDLLRRASPGGVPATTVVDRTSIVDDKLSAKQARYAAHITLPAQGRWRIHHLIPFAVVKDLPEDAQHAFVAAGWELDRAQNLIALPFDQATYQNWPNFSLLPRHDSSHPVYSGEVARYIAPIAARASAVTPTRLLAELTALELALRGHLLRRLRRIHPRLL